MRGVPQSIRLLGFLSLTCPRPLGTERPERPLKEDIVQWSSSANPPVVSLLGWAIPAPRGTGRVGGAWT